MTGLLAATDLDRTLIYSRAARQVDGVGPDSPVPDDLVCVEMLDGAPLSYLTRRAADGLRELRALALLVPVTTRTEAQFMRIEVPGGPPEYAITTNGARLLIDGVADPGWTASVRERVAGSSAPLAEVAAMLLAQSPDWMLRVRDAQEAFCYAIINRAAAPADALQSLRGWCAERGWSVSVQGRKLYCVPDLLTKTAAVDEVARRTGSTLVAAAGDSLLDAGMLAAADLAIRPAHGELHATDWSCDGLAIAPTPGIVGGEQIVEWLLAQARSASAERSAGAAQARDNAGRTGAHGVQLV
ncbi:MAG: phosphoribosyltransferase [Jatrophihabitantaceae bacterium]|nr:phosphoribosyltransferase [Jatrophihabitantaceae bacterium]